MFVLSLIEMLSLCFRICIMDSEATLFNSLCCLCYASCWLNISSYVVMLVWLHHKWRRHMINYFVTDFFIFWSITVSFQSSLLLKSSSNEVFNANHNSCLCHKDWRWGSKSYKRTELYDNIKEKINFSLSCR